MKLKLAIIAQGVSLEQIQALLQAFRDWEQAAKRAEADVQVHFTTEPQISTQEARALLQRLSPPLKKMVEVSSPRGRRLDLGARGIVIGGQLLGVTEELTFLIEDCDEEGIKMLQEAQSISLIRVQSG